MSWLLTGGPHSLDDRYAYSAYWQEPSQPSLSTAESLLGYYLNGSSMVSFEIPGESPARGENRRTNLRDSTAAAIATFALDHPLTDDAWCNNNPGRLAPFRFAGLYAAYSPNSGFLLSRTIHNCAHCAWVEATRIATERGVDIRLYSLLNCNTEPSFSGYLPPMQSPEIIGETSVNSATVKDAEVLTGVTCGQCGFFGHNARGCDSQPKFHDRIGIEVEGRFLNRRDMMRMADADGMDHCGDGSLRSSTDSSAEPYEFKTKPGSVKDAINQLIKYYPDETGSDCGMHVHISFDDPMNLTVLYTDSFYKYFRARWEAWGARMGLDPESQFFKRLRGDNDYCIPNDDSGESLASDMMRNDRYLQLNFTAYSRHKTLECRMLPMFRRSSLGVAAVQELVSIFEDYLANEAHSFGHEGEAGASVSALQPVQLDPFELEIPSMEPTHEDMELDIGEELPPVPEGHIRIGLPVNQPITIERLYQAFTARRAA